MTMLQQSDIGKILRKAANNNDAKTLEKLLMDPLIKSFINEQDMSGRTALYIAVERNNHESVQLLLRNYADSSIRTVKGSAALICAAGKGHIESLRYVFKNI